MSKLKKFFILLLVLIFISSCFAGCDKILGKLPVKKIAMGMDYYNQKAVDSINGLIGKNPQEAEQWLIDTFGNEIVEANVSNEGAGPSYISRDETVKLFFISDESGNRFFIEPNISDKDVFYGGYLNHKDFANDSYRKDVMEYCDDENADYRKAPMVMELCLYDYDKPEKANLCYFYLFRSYGGWGWEGDQGPFAQASFIYKNNTFVVGTPNEQKNTYSCE